MIRSPAVSSNTVYFTGFDGTTQGLYSLNETNGKLNWVRALCLDHDRRFSIPDLGRMSTSLTTAAPCTQSIRGTGKLDWKKSVGGLPENTPDIANGEVYVVATGLRAPTSCGI